MIQVYPFVILKEITSRGKKAHRKGKLEGLAMVGDNSPSIVWRKGSGAVHAGLWVLST